MNKTTILALLVVGILAGSIIAWAVTTYVQIPTSGDIKVPADIEANPNSINWGTFIKGINNTSTRFINLTNTGEEPTLPLTIKAIDLPSYCTLYEDISGEIIPAHGWIIANFTLVVDTTLARSIAFSIDIGAD